MIEIGPSDNLTLLIFAATYLALAAGHLSPFKINRTGIALLGAILMVATGRLSPHQALLSVNFVTLITLYGLMILSGQLWLSGFYTWAARHIVQALDHPKKFLLFLMGTSALLSAFLINDVVCLAFTPVLCSALLKKRMNPVPFLVGLALAANLGAAATPIGNPQNILIAAEANLRFGSYLLWCLPPVLLSLAAAFALTWQLGKKDLWIGSSIEPPSEEFPELDRRQTAKGLLMLGVAIALFFTPLPRATVIITMAGLLLLSRTISTLELLKKVDYSILTLFTALFVIVGGIKNTSLPQQALGYLQTLGINLHNPYLLSAVTVGLSNLMSNAATVMLLVRTLPLQDPTTAYVLSLANSFAGNLLLLGSIANLIVAEQASQRGIEIRFRTFAKYGVPVTLMSFLILLLWIWLRTWPG